MLPSASFPRKSSQVACAAIDTHARGGSLQVHTAWELAGFDPLFGPESLMLKYNTLGQTTGLLHALPGAMWCALAPLQLIGPQPGSGRSRHR